MTVWTFTVLGPPRPKARARRGKDGRWRTPKATRVYETTVRNVAMLFRPRTWPLDAKYTVGIEVFFADARARDVDNAAKACLDALQTVAYHNDSQVDRVVCERGGIDPKNPRTVITITIKEAT
jgi:Holliday junction resolvase RusA-like endonuclease